jgi:hypothetical protein
VSSHPERDVMGLMLTTNAGLVADVLRADDHPDPDALMRAIAATRSLSVIVDDTLRSLVAQARGAGRTWAEIGELLGVTRQAAFQRFGGEARPAGGDGGAPLPGAQVAAATALDAFLASRFDELRERFDDRMLRACPVSLLRSLRESLQSGLGVFRTHGEARLTTHDGYTLADVAVVFERGTRTARVVFDAGGRIAGLFLLDGT